MKTALMAAFVGFGAYWAYKARIYKNERDLLGRYVTANGLSYPDLAPAHRLFGK